MASILVVDDDKRIRELLSQFLSQNGFNVSSAANAAEARAYIATQKFDIHIFDIMMPGQENGLDLLRSLSNNKTPTILLTAKDTLQDKIDGFEDGADDYLVKPFEPLELLARIKTLLRRSKSDLPAAESLLNFGDISFDIATSRLRNQDNQEIVLSSTELVLFKILAQSPFHPFSRYDLCNKAGFMVGERTIDVQITRLRKKLNDDAAKPRFIKTIRHVGYALCPDNVDGVS